MKISLIFHVFLPFSVDFPGFVYQQILQIFVKLIIAYLVFHLAILLINSVIYLFRNHDVFLEQYFLSHNIDKEENGDIPVYVVNCNGICLKLSITEIVENIESPNIPYSAGEI